MRNAPRGAIAAAIVLGALLVGPDCGSDDDPPATPSLAKPLTVLKKAEQQYFRTNRTYTENFADLSLLQVDQHPTGVLAGFSSPGSSIELSVSSDGKYVVIALSDSDEGRYATLLKGGNQAEGCAGDC